MGFKGKAWAAGVIGLLLLVMVPGAFGQTSIVPGTKDELYGFHPYISLKGTWDDNINLTQDNRISDFITTVSPGLKYISKGSGYYVDLGYELGMNFYASLSENNYISHDGHLTGFYDIDRRWTVRLNETVTRSRSGIETYTVTGPSGPQVTTAANTNATLYLRNVVEPSVEYKFGRENLVSFLYRNNIYRPDDSTTAVASMENAFNPHLAYWFDIRNGIALDYTYSKGNFDNQPNVSTQSNYVGHLLAGTYTYRFNPRSSTFLKYTYNVKDYDPPTSDYTVQSPTIGVDYAFSATLKGHAEFGWFWQSVDVGSSQSAPNYNFSLTQTGKRTTYYLAFMGGYREQLITTENLGFSRYNTLMATVTHQLQQRLTLNLSGTLSRDEYESPSRTDNTYIVTGSLAYQPLKWLTLSLEGTTNARESDLPGNSYRENKGIFKLTASY